MDTQRYPHAEALAVAEELKAALSPACERIEIAGSLRRGKPDVGDIELLCIPRALDRLWLTEGYDQLDVAVRQMIAAGQLRKRLAENGRFAGYGPQNKLMVDVASGIGVDLFSTTLANWGMAMFVRTGPVEWNMRMMSHFREIGMRGHAYGGVEGSDGQQIDCPDEETVFRLLGWQYMPPEERK